MKVVILGCGFAGIQAVKKIINANYSDIELTVIDKNNYSTMMPAIPDVAGDFLKSEYCIEKIKDILGSDINLVQDTIININLENKYLQSEHKKYHYDYLVISGGSKVNFFQFNKNLDKVYTLDSFESALKINEDVKKYIEERSEPHIVISGAGYTGLELAVSLRKLSEKYSKDTKISIVERNTEILPFLHSDEKEYIKEYLDKNDIKIIFDSIVKDFDGTSITLKKDEKINDVFFIWCSGTRFSVDNINGNVKTLSDGRIIVDENLNIIEYPSVFVAGDSAAIKKDGNYLRKAVNFAYYSGKVAGENIVRKAKGKKLKAYRPFDAGWVIPLRDISTGRMFTSFKIGGKFGVRLHYLMCGLRNFSFENFNYFSKVSLLLTGGGFMKKGILRFLFGSGNQKNIGLLLLRIFAGIAIATHGYGKVFGGMEGFTGYVTSLGMPAFLAPAAAISEFVGGICLAAGLLTRFWSLFIGITMSVAVFVAHSGQAFAKKELALMYLFVAILFIFSGAGKWSIDSLIKLGKD